MESREENERIDLSESINIQRQEEELRQPFLCYPIVLLFSMIGSQNNQSQLRAWRIIITLGIIVFSILFLLYHGETEKIAQLVGQMITKSNNLGLQIGMSEIKNDTVVLDPFVNTSLLNNDFC